MNPNPNEIPPEPVLPEDWECCGSECGDACIHEIYRREKAAYDAHIRTLNEAAGEKTD